ncbi:MAG: glycosyltransferase family 4 protein [Acidimicrobiales bacterium]
MSARQHVGINLLWLVPGVVGGSEEYTTRALRALAAMAPPDLDVTLFVLAPFAAAHPDLVSAYPTVTVGIDGRSKPRRVAAEAAWLPRVARRRGIDLMHHAGGVIPPGPAIGRLPPALTIHDLQPLVLPENFSRLKRRWLATMIPRSAAKAGVVLTPSDPASASVVDLLGIAPERVRTVPHGIEPPAPVDERRQAEVRTRYRLAGPVVLYPAIPYAHKEHTTLVRAFAQVAATRPDVTLVLAGDTWITEADLAAAIRASGASAQVRRTGRVGWDDLHALYSVASVVAVPSRFEGFGAPVLEAMAAGVAVVAADATALPWVVGDAGVLVPVGDVNAWATALSRLLDDPGELARRAVAGRARAATFTWERTALALAAGYRQAARIGEDGRRP